MKTIQSRQKSKNLEFKVGDKVFSKVAPMKDVIRFGNEGKLSLRYVGPFEILEKVEEVAYKLALPPMMKGIHDVFRFSALRKYVANPSYILDYEPL